jgi:signal recognition particle receptor subunit beta
VGKLLNLATQTDRTIYFDLLPVELGDIKGYKIRFQLATVPGQTAFNETRRVVLKGTDGIVFVADSQWTMLPKNLESWQNLKENLRANGVSFEGIPIVIQYNKRDLTDILSVDALQEALGLSSYPFVEAVASAGRGVTETFKLISKLTFVDLLRRLQGRKPDEPAASLPRREPDDLLSWKDSLLNRAAAPGVGDATNASAKRPLTLVPSLPEEAPFAAAEEPSESAEASVHEEADAPFGDAATPPAMPASSSPSIPAEAGSTAPMPAVAAPAPPTAQAPQASEPPASEPPVAPAPPVAFDDLAVPAMPEISPVSPVFASGWDPDASFPKSPAVEPLPAAAPSVPEPAVAPVASASTLDTAAPPPPPAAMEHVESVEAVAPPVAPVVLDVPPTGEAFAALTDDTDSRIRALEARLDEALAAIAREHEERSRTEESTYAIRGRLEALESESRAIGKTIAEKQQDFVGRLEKLAEAGEGAESATRASITEMQEMFAASEKRHRISEDDVAMALRSFGERGEKLHQQLGAIASQIEVLEAAIREKTAQSRREADDIRSELATIKNGIEEKIGQGRREAEDIRSQLSPLLEAHQQRAATDERLSQEFDRLRESLAESLGDLSERLRRAVRGL